MTLSGWRGGQKKQGFWRITKISFSCSFCSSDRTSILGLLISVTTRSIWPFAFSAATLQRCHRPPLKANFEVAVYGYDWSDFCLDPTINV